MDCTPPDSSVHGIFQARILEWVAISFSRGSSLPRDWTHISCIGNVILFNNKRGNTNTHRNMKESWEYYAKWNKWHMKRLHTIWLQWEQILGEVKYSDGRKDQWLPGNDVEKGIIHNRTQGNSLIMELFYILIVVVVSTEVSKYSST